MSARGARSRKVQAKEVEKKEKKLDKGKAVGTNHDDAFAGWRATPSTNKSRNNGISRSITVSSRATSRSSGTNDGNHRPRLDTLDSACSSETWSGNPPSAASVSDTSTQGKEKARFQANGKETKAPRGRGGGVPVKKTVGPSQTSLPAFRVESTAPHPTSNQRTWQNFKYWDGGKDARPYTGFEHVSLELL